MHITTRVRTPLMALFAFAASSSASYADGGYVRLTIYKAGFIIGGSGGSGTLDFHGQTYGLSAGGIDYGILFGGSKTILRGRVSHISRPSDVAGVYAAAGAGIAVGAGARAIVLTNQKGAVLQLSGRQVGLIANAFRFCPGGAAVQSVAKRSAASDSVASCFAKQNRTTW